ncbi:MAG: hypothetical protein ABI553_02470 [Chloroflexota bacterium]
MPRHHLEPRVAPGARRIARILAAFGLVVASLGSLPGPVAAVDPPTMEARILLGGNARAGSWMAISVHLKNNGPAVSGELRLAAGAQSQTRFGTSVELPTQSDQVYVLYAQTPAFGSAVNVVLQDGETTIASTTASFALHDPTQLVVALIAEHPERIVGSFNLLPNQNQVTPAIVSVAPEDLPERVEAWGAIDRIVWQDVDSERLSTGQRNALRGWVAGGGRLVIAGGTVGPRALSAFPDTLLPYRPVVTMDAPAASLSGILGPIPSSAGTVPALAGAMIDGRATATVAGQAVAAERTYGSGSVTLIGFDPSVDWIAKTDAATGLWRRLLPARRAFGPSFSDDNNLVNAVSQLPALALPPLGGLLALLGAYILLVGPINYLILRRLDRREWAWVTIPILIGVFAVSAYGIGAALRGSDVIINQVSIVRGAPGTTDGTAQVYIGVFSPSRATYQVTVPGGALLSTPVSGDGFGVAPGTGITLDVLQGDPARVRDLAVGFGSLRTIRAETAVAVPLIQANLRLEAGHLKGTLKNASTQRLEAPAVVLGQTVAVLKDLEPGTEATIDVVLQNLPAGQGQGLSDKVVGQFSGDPTATTENSRAYVRHTMVDQLTFDPNFGSTGILPVDGPVVLAWGSAELLPVEIAGQEPRKLGNILYYLPATMTIHGLTTFSSDLIHSTVVGNDALMFSKDPTSVTFGRGTATVAYTPIGFAGRIATTELTIGLNFGGVGVSVPPTPVKPLASIPPPCPNPPIGACGPIVQDGLAEVELLDLGTQTWHRLPHLQPGMRYSVADAGRYVDPATGAVQVRFVNDGSDSVGFGVDMSITGNVQ